MVTRTASAELPPEIRSLLLRLRRRIRAYVWLEGLSFVVIWIGVTFWLGLALDYLPVLAGVGEMPRPARAVLLTLIAAVLAVIVYRWLIRRLFARLADHSLAVLLERRFRDFRDGLITSVELTSDHAPITEAGREMLAETERQALQRIRSVHIADVFNFRPLTVSISLATLLAVTLGAFYIVSASAFETGVRRIWGLEEIPWPRRARIEVVGVERRNSSASEAVATVVPFQNGMLKAAKGAHLSLLVRADASQPVVPEVCSIHYATDDGDRGRVNMTSVGGIRDGYQLYKYDGKPFDGVLSGVQFDVVGFDHRVSRHSIQVVDSPTLIQIQLNCEFPPYMVDERLSQWLPRTLDYTSGMQLPRGTRFTVQCRANKSLTRVEVSNPDTSETADVPVQASDHTAFAFVVEEMGEHLTLDVVLTDTDQVQSERPYRMHITGIDDQPPAIEMRLAGIGTAVTQDVLLPARGRIADDYGLARAWVELLVNGGEPREFAFQPAPTGEAEISVDLRSERGKPDGLTLQPKDKLHLIIKATDKRDLGNGPNQAAGDHHALDVVTPDQLLARLEARELELRRRFEQIIDEMTETRDMLLRIRTDGPGQAEGELADRAAERGAPPEDANQSTAERFVRVWSLRLLRARQSLMQSQKSSQEILGVAEAFRDIREELINNRVDTVDRKSRLQEQIADPLQRIGAQQFPELDRRLEKLALVLSQVEQRKTFQDEDPTTLSAAQESLDQANQILFAMDEVLQQMIQLQDFNELLDLVRSLIAEQEQLMNDVKKEQKSGILELLK